MIFATCCSCRPIELDGNGVASAGAEADAAFSRFASLMPRLVMPFEACTSARPLSNVSAIIDVINAGNSWPAPGTLPGQTESRHPRAVHAGLPPGLPPYRSHQPRHDGFLSKPFTCESLLANAGIAGPCTRNRPHSSTLTRG